MTPQATGVWFTNVIPPARHLTNQILINGSGVTAGDIDRDGKCDLFFCGIGGGSRCYRNLGNWKFEDVTGASGLSLARLDATGAALSDLDGDGDLDLVVNSLGQGTLVHLNDGKGHFQPHPETPILNFGRAGTSLAIADLDNDGWLDLYVANYRTSTLRDQPQPRFALSLEGGEPLVTSVNGQPATDPAVAERFAFRYRKLPNGGVSILHEEQGEPDALFRNLGQGRFTPLSFTNGTFLDEANQPLVRPPLDWGLSVLVRDLNGDGAPDIYVCNDFSSPDRVWTNDGRGRFRAVSTHALRHTSLSTMALDVADINRDGHDDIFTADMLSREHWRRLVQKNEPNPNIHLFVDSASRPQYARNSVHLARGDGTYAEIAPLAGLEASEWTWTSMFLDVDLDGFEDLLVANGFERDYMNMDANRRIQETRMRVGRTFKPVDMLELNRLYPRLVTANAAFRNQGDLTFVEVSQVWGFDLRSISQGMCAADLDNDGDLDLAINNSNDGASLLRNEGTAPRVAVRLKGRPPNTRGVGARITLLGGAVPMQSQEVVCGGRFQSSDDAMRVFAAGSATNLMTLKVAWRSGARTVRTNLQANRIYEVDESQGNVPPAPSARAEGGGMPGSLFRDVSDLLDHRHAQEPGNDFEKQALLPRKLSTAGPGLAWVDLDEDGLDDLVIGAGLGSTLGLFGNQGSGHFVRLTNQTPEAFSTEPGGAVLAGRHRDGGTVLLLAAGESAEAGENGAPAWQFTRENPAAPWRRSAGATFPKSAAAPGPMATADVDGDGSLELLVGGRYRSGRWPEAVPSLLLRQQGDGWVEDPDWSQALATAERVNGAVFTDLDGDGFPELALACDWGPLRLFRNERGHLAAWDWKLIFPGRPSRPPLPSLLSRMTGWWNGVAAGDFDGDGRMDLAASNWGRNTKYERYRSRPLQLLYGDFNGDGRLDLMESCFEASLQQYVPILSVWTLSRGLPWLLAKYPTYESFSRVSVAEAMGQRLPLAKSIEAAWLESAVFLNRGDHFEVRPLPIEAQMTPAFAVCVADFDGDGHEDLFLSQNFFGVPQDTSRYDAGRGLLLRGDGQGSFASVPGHVSGLLIYGEQRGAAVSDYDGDGRVDLVVAQHGAETKLYHNERAQAGWRIRLAGPPANPQAIGAVLRLKSGAHLGPARELHGGSGYWSQDSPVQILAQYKSSKELWVRWPGGRVTTSLLPEGAREVTIETHGAVRKNR